MQILIDTTGQTLTLNPESEETQTIPLFSDQAFEIISNQWLKVGWNQKYPYSFSWMGRPLIQLPEDVMRVQEVVYQVKPDVIIETGVAHGGSLILYASLLKAMGKEDARVVGVDIEIRRHNREAIEKHELFPMITLIEGSSTDPEIVAEATSHVRETDTVLVILDSCHTKDHVAAELAAYHTLVTPGSYIVATDGSMKDLYEVPRGESGWEQDNPTQAAKEFANAHPEFEIEQPNWPFNESSLTKNITHWPSAYIKRVSS